MLTGVVDISTDTLNEILEFTIRAGGNLMTFGPAGVGKTEMAMQAAERAGFQYVYLNLSVLEAPDLMGLPMVDQETRTTAYAPPRMIPRFNPRERPVVLLVDEVDKAKPELQNPMLELFQFRSINGNKMNVHSVISTGNLPDEGAFSQPVSHALTNRCKVYRVSPNPDAWIQWAASAQINPLVVGFISRNVDYLLRPPHEGDSTAYAHPSPRAWTLAARDLNKTDDSHSVHFQSLLVSGYVGSEAATKFQVWLEHYRYIEPIVDKLFRDGVHPSSSEIGDAARAIVCAISACNEVVKAAMVMQDKTSAKDKEAAWKILEKGATNVFKWLPELPTEYATAALRSTMNKTVIQNGRLLEIPVFMKVFEKIQKVVYSTKK
jgi:hypothetical protein